MQLSYDQDPLKSRVCPLKQTTASSVAVFHLWTTTLNGKRPIIVVFSPHSRLFFLVFGVSLMFGCFWMQPVACFYLLVQKGLVYPRRKASRTGCWMLSFETPLGWWYSPWGSNSWRNNMAQEFFFHITRKIMIEQESFEESDLFFVSTRSWVLNTWRSWFRVSSLSSSNVGESFTSAVLAMFICRGREVSSLSGRQISSKKSLYTISDWWFGTFSSIQLGMSSSQLTNSYFFKGIETTNQTSMVSPNSLLSECPRIAILMSLMKMIKHGNFRVPIRIPQKHGHIWALKFFEKTAWFDTAEREAFHQWSTVKFAAWCVENDMRTGALLKSNANLTLEHNVR